MTSTPVKSFTTSSFFPQGYVPPKPDGNSGFFKVEEGKNKIRILDVPVIGYGYWNPERKKIRSRGVPQNPDLGINKFSGESETVKEFWCMPVWDYGTNSVKIWDFDQISIQGKFIELMNDEDWGDPRGYDVSIIKKKGKGDRIEYSLTPSNKGPIAEDQLAAYQAANLDLQKIMFGDSVEESTPEPKQGAIYSDKTFATFMEMMKSVTSSDDVDEALSYLNNKRKARLVELFGQEELDNGIAEAKKIAEEILDF